MDNAPTETRDPEPAEPGFNPLGVLRRRWPLLAAGLAVGCVVAALVQVTTPPAYQSSAQVLVVKKRTDVIQSADVRVGVLEDYVSTQQTLIKSEKFRRAAAVELRKQKLNRPLPEGDPDNRIAAGVIGAGLTVARDKDAGAAGGGSGVLNLSYRGPDPADARAVLDAVFKAFQLELYNIYDQATQDRVKTLDQTLDVIRAQRKVAAEERLRLLNELRLITTEDVAAIRTRVTALRERQYSLELDKANYAEQINLVKSAGSNDKSRRAVLAQLTAQTKLGAAGEAPNGPDQMIRALEAQKAELSSELGKDHQRIKAIDNQINYLKSELKRLNPDAASAVLDELGAYEQQVAQRLRTTESQLKQLELRLLTDEKNLQAAGGIQNQIEALTDRIQQFDKDISRIDAEKMTTQVTQGSGGYTAQLITPPSDGAQVAPVRAMSVLTGLSVGLLLALVVVALAEVTDRSFRSPADIRRRLGVPVIGHVPSIRTKLAPDPAAPAGLDPVLVTALRPKSVEAEAYRGVRTQLYFSTQGKGHTVIQVTSPNPGDGKSTLAANLAISVAQSGKRVVLVDCDMRKPRIHKLFNVSSGDVGLSGVIGGKAGVLETVQRSVVENLDLLPCGARPANPAELLTSPDLPRVLAELRAAYDFVIVDTPPLLAVSDPAVVAPRADGVVLVFKMTKASRPAAERAREQLAALGANCLGVVVNGYFEGSRSYGSYSYGTGYGYRYSDYQYAEQYAHPDKPGPDDDNA